MINAIKHFLETFIDVFSKIKDLPYVKPLTYLFKTALFYMLGVHLIENEYKCIITTPRKER